MFEHKNLGNRLIVKYFGVVSFLLVYLAVSSTISFAKGPDHWNLRNPLPTTNTLNDLEFANGRFVAVGDHGSVLFSKDGISWSAGNVGYDDNLSGVAYGNNTYVATGTGVIYTSADGLNWTRRDINTRYNDLINGVNFLNQKFVIVGTGQVFVSTDGINWNESINNNNLYFMEAGLKDGRIVVAAKEFTTNNQKFLLTQDGVNWVSATGMDIQYYKSIEKGPQVYVSVGWTIKYSTDGVNWQVSYSSSGYKAAAYGNNVFVVVGDNGGIMTSPDAQRWTKRGSSLTNYNIQKITFANNMFTAVGDHGLILSSPDGSKWQNIYLEGYPNLKGTAAGNGIFAAFSDNCIYSSKDGKVWNKALTLPTNEQIFGINNINGNFYALGFGFFYTSTDGQNWTKKSLTFSGWHGDPTPIKTRSLTYGNGNYVMVGDGVAVSSDGVYWLIKGTWTKYQEIVYGNNIFVAVGGNSGGAIYSSSDANTWTTRVTTPTNVKSITFGNGIFVALCLDKAYVSQDGITWVTKALYLSRSFNGAAYGGEGSFVAVGDTGSIIQSDSPSNAILGLSAASMEFGNFYYGESLAVVKNVTITNKGIEALKVDRLILSGDALDFQIKNNPSGSTLKPGESKSFQILFSPLSTGEKKANICFGSNDLTSPAIDLNLHGQSLIKPLVNSTFYQKTIRENGSICNFFIYRNESATPLTVRYKVLGTAVTSVDYQRLPGTLTIPAGETSGVVVINLFDDQVSEASKTLKLQLEDNPAYKVNPQGSNEITILDDDGPEVNIKAADSIAAEPGKDTGILEITRFGDLGKAINMKYNVTGTAVNGKDYYKLPSQLTFAPGQNTMKLIITPIDDKIYEPRENVTVNLIATNDYKLGVGKSATVLINDNDKKR